MKKIFITFLFVFFSFSIIYSQIVGGSGNGESPTKDVKASTVDAGGFSGDVSLFTGTYNSSYNLGTVSTPSGLSYTATLSYSSTFSVGTNMPHSSGIPYGEGWNLEIPMLSVSTEDYNKYTIKQTTLMNDHNKVNDPIINNVQEPTPIFVDEEGNCEDAAEEGRIFYYAPMLNIPSVASGRLVYKVKEGNEHVFVLHTFERYIEARLQSDNSWVIILDDGTQYHLAKAIMANRNASNQRVQTDCFEPTTLSNLILPKTEYLAWYCTKITHPNFQGEINFEFEEHGCFDFFEMYKSYVEIGQDLLTDFFQNDPFHDPLVTPCKEVFLKKINSGFSELVLEYDDIYDQIDVNDGEQLPKESDPIHQYALGVYDPLYSDIIMDSYNYLGIFGSSGFESWYRYHHLKSSELKLLCPNGDGTGSSFSISPTNPYSGIFGQSPFNNEGHLVREPAECNLCILPFKHGYLESPMLLANEYPAGDIYGVRCVLQNYNSYNALFDINLTTGDFGQQLNITNFPFGENQEIIRAKCYNRNRGESIFSTYNQAIKWKSDSGERSTFSSFFMMPNLPNSHDGFFIQIGAANSDHEFDKLPADVADDGGSPGDCPVPICDLEYPSYSNPLNEENDNIALNSGSLIPNNFGIGAPWLMTKEFYSNILDYCNCPPGTDMNCGNWWNFTDNTNEESKPCKHCFPPSGPNVNQLGFAKWANDPTRTRQTVLNDIDDHCNPDNSPCTQRDIALEDISIIRYAKRPYMLKNVRLKTKNKSGSFVTSNQLKFYYELKTVDVYTTKGIDVENIPNPDDFVQTCPTGRKRNIFLLSKIEQPPYSDNSINPEPNNSSFITHFKYEPTHNISNPSACSCYGFIIGENWVLTEVTDAIGKTTIIEYKNANTAPGVPNNGLSYAISSFEYTRRPSLALDPNAFSGESCEAPDAPCSIIPTDEYVSKIGRAYAYQLYMVVESKTVNERDGQQKRWNYNFSTPRIYMEQTPFTENFQYDKQSTPKLGFGTATVTGPYLAGGSGGPVVTYIHSTAPLTWGKILSMELYDVNGNLVSTSSNLYVAVWAFESPIYRTGNTGEGYYSNYQSSGRPDYDNYGSYEEYLDALVNWLGGIQPMEHPDFSIKNDQFDVPQFYETRYHDVIADQQNNPDYWKYYLHSYFIKKVEDKQKNYDTNGNFIETTNKYQYFDAKYNGKINSAMSGYHALNIDDPLTYEPSFQLYSVKTFSDQWGGEDEAYSMTENFYWFDRENNLGWHTLSGETEITREKNMRNVPFQVRSTTKAPGENAIQRSTYYQYKSNWANNSLLPWKIYEQVQDGGVNYEGDLMEYGPSFPYEVLQVKEIVTRNNFGQVTLEEDAKGLKTSYAYNNLGQLTNYTIGEGENYPLATSYSYNELNLLNLVNEPNGLSHSYVYDDYLRLKETRRNGVLLESTNYSHWQNNHNETFEERAPQNYTSKTSFLTSSNSINEVHYIDPLGRDLTYIKDGIAFDDNIYDIWDRPIIKIKPGAGLTINGDLPSIANAEFYYEPAPRSNILRSSKYTLDALGDNAMRYEHTLVDKGELLNEVTNPLASDYIPEGSYWRTKTIDEDEKVVIEFTNAIGQKVASVGTAAYAPGPTPAPVVSSTVFRYDSHGNVKKVSDPNANESFYNYNYLGQLFNIQTPDEGISEYGFNQVGLTVVRKDGDGVVYAMNYDKFGRMIVQARNVDGITDLLEYEGNSWIENGTTYSYIQNRLKGAINGGGIKEKEWFYNTRETSFDNLMLNNTESEISGYGGLIGRVAHVNNYDFFGILIEMHYYSYTPAGFINKELSQFQETGITNGLKGRAFSIHYENINNLGSPEEVTLDLNANLIYDFVYSYRYDNWNNVTSIGGTLNGSGIHQQIASYGYNYVTGGLDSKIFYDKIDNTTIKVLQIGYDYDERFRLSNMKSELFDMDLLYDEQTTGLSSVNYNGNINETISNYKLHAGNTPLDVVNEPADNFQFPTFYRYQYDNLNRLITANAELLYNDLPSGAINGDEFGDEEYEYDAAGNFKRIKRWFDYDQQNHQFLLDDYTFGYFPGSNKLSGYSSQQNGSSFEYYANGGMKVHSDKGINDVWYGRGSYPFLLLGGTPDNYLYDINDARIYKKSNDEEIYIRDASGREIAVYNIGTGRLAWYVYGPDRAAKIEFTWCQGDIRDDGGCTSATPLCNPAMTAAQQIALQNLTYINDPNSLILPTKLLRIKLCYGDEFYILHDELPYIYGNYNILQQINITNLGQQFTIEVNGIAQSVNLSEMLTFRSQHPAESYKIEGYNSCVQISCTNDAQTCTEEMSEQQHASLGVPSNPTFPTRILRIRLCDMTETYILLESLSSLKGFYQILSQIEVANASQNFELSINGGAPSQVDFNGLQPYLGNTQWNISINGYESCVEPCDEGLPQCTEQDFSQIYPSNVALTLSAIHYAHHPDQLPLPNKLYKIRFCNGIERYVFQNEMHLITTSFKLLGSIDVINDQQDFWIYRQTLGYWQLLPDLETFLHFRPEAKSYDVLGFQCDEKGNLICPDQDAENQHNTAQLLRQNMQGMSTGVLTLPNRLNSVRLCDKTFIYLLNEELEQLPGDYEIIRSVKIESANQSYLVQYNGRQPEVLDVNGVLAIRSEALIMQLTEDPTPENNKFIEYPDGDYPAPPEISYYVLDYLGNTRIVFNTFGLNPNNVKYKLEFVGDYFPYGKILRNFECTDKERFISTENERDKNTQFDYRMARFYDSEIGRFLGVDPLAAKYSNWSTYQYAADNPIIVTDPAGMDWSESNKWLAGIFGVFGNGAGNDTDLIPSSQSNCCPDLTSAIAMLVARWQMMINRGSQNLMISSTKSSSVSNNPLVPLSKDGRKLYDWAQANAGLGEIIYPVLEINQTIASLIPIEAAGATIASSTLGFTYRRSLNLGFSSVVTKGETSVFKHSFKYADRVRMRAVQDPVSHNFPYSFDDAILSTNPIFKNNGYKIFQQSGTMNGKNGVFEIGLTKDRIIDHRFFRPIK